MVGCLLHCRHISFLLLLVVLYLPFSKQLEWHRHHINWDSTPSIAVNVNNNRFKIYADLFIFRWVTMGTTALPVRQWRSTTRVRPSPPHRGQVFSNVPRRKWPRMTAELGAQLSWCLCSRKCTPDFRGYGAHTRACAHTHTGVSVNADSHQNLPCLVYALHNHWCKT